MIFKDREKRKPREEYTNLARKVQRLHPDESPIRLAAILERIKDITTEIRER
jgi:iron-sulfur cluster repair protein YtfE (RIC family)